MSKKSNVKTLVQLALLTAIELIMAFTPLGYLKIGPVSITFMAIPVAVGAIVLGPISGAFLGLVFGLTSFSQCFGADTFGTTLLGINAFSTAFMCLVPRILMGLFAGLIFGGLKKTTLGETGGALLSSLACSVINTVLFVGSLIVLFGNTEYIKGYGDSVIAVIMALVSVNTVIEAIACTIIGGAVSKAVIKYRG